MAVTQILRSIVNDPIRKIFAIVFAFGLWLFVAVEGTYTDRRDVKIAFIGLPESLTVTDAPLEIPVTFTGKGRSLLGFWLLPPTVIATVTDAKTGSVKITSKDLAIPSNPQDVSVQYDIKTMDLRIDEKVKQTVPVTIPMKGSPPERYAIGMITISDTVLATGPKGYLRGLADVATESLDVHNRTASFYQKLKLRAPAGSIRFNQDYVTAMIEIDTVSRRLLTNLPVKIISKQNQTVSAAALYLDTLIVAGANSRISKLKKTDIDIMIRLSDLKTGEYSLPAEIISPAYVKPVHSSPKKFKIKIY
ncbi:MAG TPA: CdaR family protein [bacterium]